MSFSDHIDGAIERTLRALPPGTSLKTGELVKTLPYAEGTAYKRLLAIAARCPAASQDKDHSFTRFGRICYPWRWGHLGQDQPLIGPPPPPVGADIVSALTLDDGTIEIIARRVAAILKEGDHLTLATIAEPSSEPEECINCGFPGLNYDNGLCPDCVSDLAGPEEV